MTKKLRDLKLASGNQKINLKGSAPFSSPAKKLKKKKNVLYKLKSPINEVKDLISAPSQTYRYVKGVRESLSPNFSRLLRLGIAGFFIIILINSINVYFIGKNLEKEISRSAYEGYILLLDAGKSATKIQFDKALYSFNKASENFEAAKKELWFISKDKTVYSKDNNLGFAAESLIESGQHFSLAGKYFLEALEDFNKIPLLFFTKNELSNKKPPSITKTLKEGLEKTDKAIAEINKASEKINAINEKSLPSEIAIRVSYAKEMVAEVSSVLSQISNHFPAMLKLLGDRHPHRYLLLFQNNNEIRPTGGFIGSYGIMDINNGYIEKLETHDVYDLDGSYGGIIEPPEEFKIFTGNWRLRDANYSPDFPTSAQKIRWFLEKQGGPTVDTVIALNQGLLKDMLYITGPIQVGGFGRLNADNYNLLLSFVIEGKVWGQEDPKHILKKFVPEFKESILKESNVSKVSSKLYRAIQQKHILMYSADSDIQDFLDTLGLSGRSYQPKEKEDFLSVINISTGGTKSDQFIEENIHHHTRLDKYGTVINELKISRKHLWTDKIYQEWKKELQKYGFNFMPDYLIDILGRGRNRVSIRIYVPEGSILLDSAGAEITTKYDKDLKKTYFFTSIETQAGKLSEFTVKYKAPFTLNFKTADIYKLIIEKQPGSRGSILTKTLETDGKIHNLGYYPPEAKINREGGITFATNLTYDRFFSGLFGRK